MKRNLENLFPRFPGPKWLGKIFILISFAWMALYPVYTNYYKGFGNYQHHRHLEFLAGESIFYNPWQYRVLSPFMVEGIYQICDHTIFNLVDFSKYASINFIKGAEDEKLTDEERQNRIEHKTGIIKYNLVFVGFRFIQNLIILLLLYIYLCYFVRNKLLIFFTLFLVSLVLGNAVVESDLSFNLYTDVILFLYAAIVIIKKESGWWILVLTILGSANRETSLFIPMMYYFAEVRWNQWPNVKKVFFSNERAFYVTALSTVAYVIIFFAIRSYYGFKSTDTDWHIQPGLELLKYNLFSSNSLRSYMELFAVFGLFPLWCLFLLKKMNYYLRIFFIVIVPLWFFINFYFGIVLESRIFLVPTLVVFYPIVLEYVDSWKRQSELSN